MQGSNALPNTAQHVAAALAKELTAGTVGLPVGSARANAAEQHGVVLRGDKVVYIPGFAPDLEHLESKYGEVGSINHYQEHPDSHGLIKLVIMNFND